MSVALVVIAKAPVPGRSKTRLTTPCTPERAAALAEAALRDTLGAVAAASAGRRVIALEGAPGDWLAWWTSRSMRAAATMASPGISPQASKPRLLVMMIEPRS